MTDATPPAPPAAPAHTGTKIAKAAAATVDMAKKAVSAVLPHVTWTLHWAATLTGLKTAWSTILLLCRNPSSWLIIGPLLVLVYAVGHQEEALKYKAAFSKLSACVTELGQAKKPVAVPVCAPAAPIVIAPPAAAAPPPAAPPAKATVTPAKHKRAHKAKSGLFG